MVRKKLRAKEVFLVNKFETTTGKHDVYFCKDLNNPKNSRSFRKMSDAKKFAINKAKKIKPHYNYSNVDYINNRTKVKITCDKGHEFHIEPRNILSCKGCIKCGNESSTKKRRSTSKEFVTKVTKIKPNYDYRQFSEYGSDPSIDDIKQMDMNQNYFYKPPPSKLQGLMSMIPGAGIARFLGNQIGGMLPPNRRAIMENTIALPFPPLLLPS